MHTPFLEFFTNDRNLMNGNRRVFEEIQTFVEGYYKNAKKNVQAPNVKKLRRGNEHRAHSLSKRPARCIGSI